MLIRLFLTQLLIVITISFSYSQGKLEFVEESFDFGNIVEGTVANHEFHFINKGTEPIIVSHVQASCGCTTPFWTKEPVAPGGKGVIKASYNSQGRPGVFTKSITVTSNAETPSKALTIKGTVVTKPLISPSSRAVLDVTALNMGKVQTGRKHTKTITVTNGGDEGLNINFIKSGCNCVTHSPFPGIIKPGSKAEIQLYYTPRSPGNFTEPVIINTNDKNTPEIRISIMAEVEEDKSLNSVVKENNSQVPFN